MQRTANTLYNQLPICFKKSSLKLTSLSATFQTSCCNLKKKHTHNITIQRVILLLRLCKVCKHHRYSVKHASSSVLVVITLKIIHYIHFVYVSKKKKRAPRAYIVSLQWLHMARGGPHTSHHLHLVHVCDVWIFHTHRDRWLVDADTPFGGQTEDL